MTYSTGGDAPWLVNQRELTGRRDFDWVYNNDLGAEQSNWLQTTVEGQGTLSFWWKAVSSDSGSALTFWIDGQARAVIEGDQNTWQQKTYTITGSGPHTVKWTFSQQSQEYSAWGCVDRVEWSGPLPQDPPATDWRELVYVYDAAGRRVEKKYNNVTVLKYVYDGDHCIAEYDGSDNLRRKYIYGPGVDEPVCMIEAGGSYTGTYYYHFDGLGSVVGLTNSSGNTVEVYEYDVYGRVGATDASHPNRIMFTGREYDKETGLYHYRARCYNPQIGRFLQTDPVGYGDGMNWYAYCANNALNMVDPNGCTTSPDNPPAKPADELPGFEYFEYDVYTLDQVWGWLHEVGYNWPNRLDLTAILGLCFIPDGTPLPSSPVHIKIGKGSVGAQRVFTLNGVGLLDEGTLNDIIRDDVAQVNTWKRDGLSPTNMWNLYFHCDTPFYPGLRPGVMRWLYNAPATEMAGSKIYDGADINYILEGHALHQIGLSEDEAAVTCWTYNLVAHRRVRPSGYEDLWYWFWKGYDEWSWRSTWK